MEIKKKIMEKTEKAKVWIGEHKNDIIGGVVFYASVGISYMVGKRMGELHLRRHMGGLTDVWDDMPAGVEYNAFRCSKGPGGVDLINPVYGFTTEEFEGLFETES